MKMPSISATKVIRWLLLSATLVLIFAIMSVRFDLDLGWHLRFGQAFAQTGQLPYLDTGTWTHYGQEWVNHEWGSDIVAWALFAHFPYWVSVLFWAVIAWFGFLVFTRAWRQKNIILNQGFTLLCLVGSAQIFFPRPSMVMPLFAGLVVWCLERITERKIFLYLLPLVLISWSWWHGSWSLGYIIIGCYVAGNGALLIMPPLKTFFKKSLWTWQTLYTTVLSTLVGLALTSLNPYGFQLITEVWHYFTLSYYKQIISEWSPSYTYPIFPLSLVLVGAFLSLLLLALSKRRLTLPQLLLGLGFAYASFMYKRQIMLVALAAIPLATAVAAEAWTIITERFPRFTAASPRLHNFGYAFCIVVLVLFNSTLIAAAHFSTSPWADHILMSHAHMPVAAVQFLKKSLPTEPVAIFNNFDWGGYLSWQLPEARLFLDGRGPATWLGTGTTTALAEYVTLVNAENQLPKLETMPVEYILLSTANKPVSPEQFDRLFLSPAYLASLSTTTLPALYISLATSKHWTVVYRDELATIWKRQNRN